ncbi:MAG: S8 family serine peptidase [Alphaproteobacteria bacterium]|nr:S8 family serine peptidase [Alphaproteobacteria bacterium]
MTRVFALLFLVLALSAAPAARAQLGLPVPQVPGVGEVVNQAGQQAGQIGSDVERSLQDVRRLQVRELLREHRRELEADPQGAPIVRSQILALGMSDAAIAAARAQGFDVVRSDAIDAETSMVTLRAPAGMSTRRALRRLREADSQGVYDFDHLHLESGVGLDVVGFAQSGASNGPRIGLVDSGVNSSVRVAEQRGFATERPVAGEHGSTIAGLISSAAPGARIYAADIYGGAPTGGASSALARALGWLAAENVAVINVSLVGPRNRVVEAVVARLVARGFVIVAAVGNDGPAAAPLFPASYDGVVGVTGVDARDRVLVEAGRGAQVDFAAVGVQGRARGTSYAAPIVAARLAARLPAPGASAAQNAINAMRSDARDLGARGRDDVYGYGLISGP